MVLFLSENIQDQDQDSLLVKHRNDNHSPGPVIHGLLFCQENLVNSLRILAVFFIVSDLTNIIKICSHFLAKVCLTKAILKT